MTETGVERALRMDCEGQTLVGVLGGAQASAAATAVVMVVGGPQVRAGAHRLHVLLARALALKGIPSLRFDLRGMGDSTGAAVGFEACSSDIQAAIDSLAHEMPSVERIVLWGLCDGASAILLHAHERPDPRVTGLILINPWVRTEQSLARTRLRHHYRERLMQPAFWARVFRGSVGWSAVVDAVRQMRMARRSVPSQPDAQSASRAWIERMDQGLARFAGSVNIALSARDSTAQEFALHAAQHPLWRSRQQCGQVLLEWIADADHTFSSEACLAELIGLTCRAAASEEPAARTTTGVTPRLAALPASVRSALENREASPFLQPGWWHLFEQRVAAPLGARTAWLWLQRGERHTIALPLMRQRAHRAQGLRSWLNDQIQGPVWQSMSNYYTGIYRPLISPGVTPADLAELLRSVRGELGLRRINWAPLAEEDLPFLGEALRLAGYRTRKTPAFGNWHQPVEPGTEGFRRYWSARPGALRSTVERAGRRFARGGGRLDIIESGDEAALRQAAQAYSTVYARSWKPPEPFEGFMDDLIVWAAQRGWLRLGLAWWEGRPIAAHLWLVHGQGPQRKAEIFKLAYDATAAEHSAGTLLGHALMRHVIEGDRVFEIDYLSGDDRHKALWMDARRVRWRLTAQR